MLPTFVIIFTICNYMRENLNINMSKLHVYYKTLFIHGHKNGKFLSVSYGYDLQSGNVIYLCLLRQIVEQWQPPRRKTV